MTAATMALGTAAAVANHKAQSSAAKQQNDFQNKQYTEVSKSAIEAYRRGTNQLLIRDSQETAAAFRQAAQSSTELRTGKSSAKTLVKAAGLSGNSMQDLLREYDRIDADNQFVMDTNLKMTKGQIRENIEGLRADAQSRISGAAPQPVSRPSSLALALNVGSAGLQAANTWKTWKK